MHKTVLLNEAVTALAIKAEGTYVDATFGRGGHSQLILKELSENGRLVVFDKDPEAIRVAQEMVSKDSRLIVVHSGFDRLQEELLKLGIRGIDGILFDFGLSSPQIDEAQRGFSFKIDGPLDMRMDNSSGISAKEWLKVVEEEELARVLKVYGEERFNKKIANAIVNYRGSKEISTTTELAEIIKRVIKVKERDKHPATRTFQAIRIEINHELQEIENVLPEVLGLLNYRGRMVTIAFHSLEDRLIKQYIKHNSTHQQLPKWVMITNEEEQEPPLKMVGKAVKPTLEEQRINPRSRSAIMRVAERTKGKYDES